MKCKNCKKSEKLKDDGIEWCKICKACKELSDYCRDYNKIYEDYLCYLEYKDRKQDFTFSCEKCKKR